MELYLNATSPYARLVRILLLEKGLAEEVTLRWCDPWADDADLLTVNPAGRIPALVTEEGTPLSESLLIAFYLESLCPSPALLPEESLPEVLKLTGLGQNLMDAAFTTVIARKHSGQAVDDSFLGQRRSRALQRLLAQLGQEFSQPMQQTTNHLGHLAIAVALDYLSFRLPEINWSTDYPELANWQTQMMTRESCALTAFTK